MEHRPVIVELRNQLLRQDAAIRARVRGKRIPTSVAYDVVEKSPDRGRRREFWNALQAAYRPLEPGIRELARRRNESAREKGYRSFVDLRLSEEGLTRTQLEAFIDELTRFGRSAHRELREEFSRRTGEAGWFPWDRHHAAHLVWPQVDQYFPARTMMASVDRGLRGWGFRPEKHGIRVVFRHIPQGGVTYGITIPTDVRVAVHPQSGWGWTGVLCHEMGHALHHTSTRAPSPLLRGYETLPGNAGLSEGIGGTFEEIAVNPEFLAQQPGVPKEAIATLREARGAGAARSASFMARWVGKELALYRDPDHDLPALYARMDRQESGFDPAPPTSFGDGVWIQYGFYGKSYLFAWMFAAQVLEGAVRELGGSEWPNRRMAPWLIRHWFRDGATFDWVPHMREVTGRPFGTGSLVRRLRSFGA